ncbi:putative sulfate exporter family transporter [Clostridiaceae bacterium 35-E11]
MKNRLKELNKLLPGLLFVFVIAILSIYMNDVLKSKINLEALTIGIIIGMIYNNTIGLQEKLKPGTKYSLKTLLKVGIVLLGLKLNFQSLLALGPKALLIILLFVPTVLFLARFLGKLFHADDKLATLIGVGSCICGASAVVAMSPCIDAQEDDAVVAVSIVSFLGAIGVILYSFVGFASTMSNIQYGFWSGISLHGVAHSIAAAFARGSEAGEIGTFVKMGRVVMLIPVALILSYLFRTQKQEKTKVEFPIYILYFILAGIIGSSGWMPAFLHTSFTQLSSIFILMAMISMGLSVDFKDIKNKGMKALWIGMTLFMITSISTYFIAISSMN